MIGTCRLFQNEIQDRYLQVYPPHWDPCTPFLCDKLRLNNEHVFLSKNFLEKYFPTYSKYFTPPQTNILHTNLHMLYILLTHLIQTDTSYLHTFLHTNIQRMCKKSNRPIYVENSKPDCVTDNFNTKHYVSIPFSSVGMNVQGNGELCRNNTSESI